MMKLSRYTCITLRGVEGARIFSVISLLRIVGKLFFVILVQRLQRVTAGGLV